MLIESLRPLLRGVLECKDLDDLPAYTVDQDIRCAWNNELSSPGDAARPSL